MKLYKIITTEIITTEVLVRADSKSEAREDALMRAGLMKVEPYQFHCGDVIDINRGKVKIMGKAEIIADK